MVHYRDDKGVFNAPVEKVWKLIEAHTDQNIPNIHPSYTSSKTVEQKGNEQIREVTAKGPDGRPTVSRLRMIVNPPKSSTFEWLSGPMKGTKITNTYTPEGSGTRVVVEGDVRIEGMDDASTLKIARETFDQFFEEDQRYLPKIR